MIYLIGNESEQLKGRKLPTVRQVLSVFFHKHSSLKLTIRQSASDTIADVVKVWDKSAVKIIKNYNAVTKLIKIHDEWRKLHKGRLRENSPA